MICNNPRSGFIRKNLSGEQTYDSFVPATLPPKPNLEIDDDMTAHLIAVHKKISFLRGRASHIPNLNIFLAMYIRKEALFSSQIEGTQATLDDILDPLLDENLNRDVQDAIDNVAAVQYALDRLRNEHDLPLSLRLLKDTHKVLLQHSRGQNKSPGEFRYTQNWIGPTGCSLQQASFVPPNPSDMKQALYQLELYFHEEDDLDPLIRAALIHYQFETIHPFLDGNGRIGRLLILLYLIDKNIIDSPYLYISYFLKLNRTKYYEYMTSVRTDGTYEAWVKFFLNAAEKAAQDALETIDRLHQLSEDSRVKVMDGVNGKATLVKLEHFMRYLESTPIIEIRRTSSDLGWSFPTTSKYVKRFSDAGILKEVTGRTRGRVFAYDEYLQILRKDMQPL